MLYVGLDLSRRRLDFDVLLPDGVVLSGVRFLRMSMVWHRWCSDWTMRTSRCVRRSSR